MASLFDMFWGNDEINIKVNEIVQERSKGQNTPSLQGEERDSGRCNIRISCSLRNRGDIYYGLGGVAFIIPHGRLLGTVVGGGG